jgi:hypothetical protein
MEERGIASAVLGNACLYSLDTSNTLEGINHLSSLQQVLKNPKVKKTIQKYLDDSPFAIEVSLKEPKDVPVKDFGLARRKNKTKQKRQIKFEKTNIPKNYSDIRFSDDNYDLVLIDEDCCSIYNLDVDLQFQGTIKRKGIFDVKIIDENIFIRASGKKVIEVFDRRTLKKITSFRHMDWAQDMFYSKNQEKLVTCDDKGFWFCWKLNDLSQEHKTPLPREFTPENEFISNVQQAIDQICSSPSGKLTFTGTLDCYEHPYIIWNTEEGSIYKKLTYPFERDHHGISYNCIGFTNESTILFYSEKSYFQNNEDDTSLYIYDIVKDSIINTIILTGKILAVSKFASHILYDNKNTITLLDTKNMTESQLGQSKLESAIFSSDESLLFLIANKEINILKLPYNEK